MNTGARCEDPRGSSRRSLRCSTERIYTDDTVVCIGRCEVQVATLVNDRAACNRSGSLVCPRTASGCTKILNRVHKAIGGSDVDSSILTNQRSRLNRSSRLERPLYRTIRCKRVQTTVECTNVDITVVGNRIVSVVPHAAANHAKAAVVDAANLTVMPGLIEFHSHLQKDFGEDRVIDSPLAESDYQVDVPKPLFPRIDLPAEDAE